MARFPSLSAVFCLIGAALRSPDLPAATPIKPLQRPQTANVTPTEGGRPQLASDALGNTIVVWGGSNDADGVFARAYDSSGIPVRDGRFRVDVSPGTYVDDPAIAMDADGDFVVVWAQGLAGQGADTEIFARRYRADRQPIDAEQFQVNTSTDLIQSDPAVAMAPNDDIVVTWTSQRPGENGFGVINDIRARRFSISEAPDDTQPEFTIAAGSAQTDLGESAVAMTTDGRFVVVWDDQVSPFESAGDVVAQAFNDDGALSGALPVAQDSAGQQREPAISMNAGGRFVVSWTDGSVGPDRFVRVRPFSFPLVARDSDLLVTDSGVGGSSSRVSIDARGRFVVVWQSNDVSLRGRMFRPTGRSPLGREFLLGAAVEPGVSSFPRTPNVVLDADGDFTASFFGKARLTDALPAVFVRRFRGPEPINLQALIRSRPAAPTTGTEVRYEATIINTNKRENLTGIEAIDRAIGAAVRPLAFLGLPTERALVGIHPDFVPRRAGKCLPDPRGLVCTSSGPLHAEDMAEIRFRLIPQTAGLYEATIAVASDSLDPEEENNFDADEVQVRIGSAP